VIDDSVHELKLGRATDGWGFRWLPLGTHLAQAKDHVTNKKDAWYEWLSVGNTLYAIIKVKQQKQKQKAAQNVGVERLVCAIALHISAHVCYLLPCTTYCTRLTSYPNAKHAMDIHWCSAEM
jgi:hypothetical protein